MKPTGLVILDRDGVINEDSDHYIRSAEQWQPIPGSIEAIATLHQAGYRIAVASNQSGLARGYFDELTLAAMHNLMLSLVEAAGGSIDTLCYCPHLPEACCDCRKPATGMLRRIQEELQMDTAGAYFVGDSEKDLDCALAGQCQPVLVKTGKGQQTLAALSPGKREKTLIFDDLAGFCQHLVGNSP